MSPNHPGNYNNTANLSYDILVEEGKSVVLYPLRFILESGYDFLSIKDAAETNWEL
jgi:hypothetical protein